MDKLDFYLKEVIGKRCGRDIYNEQGELLVSKATVITYDHVILLEENGMTLRADDVVEIGTDFDRHVVMIDETVEHVRTVFGEIRDTKKVPLDELQKNVIPTIHEASDSKYVLQLFTALQAKDDYTYRHNIAVGAIANLIGKWMGLDQKDLRQVTTAGLLHDVGKMLIPESILNKPGRLTGVEFAEMKKHTIYGYDILKETVGINHRQALVALQHHERIDGSGYPMGLYKDEIDIFSRIVAVADVFHAMSSNRIYQNQSPFYKVLSEMQRDMFHGLDPEITILFIEKTMNALIGNSVILTDGRLGTILMVHRNNPIQPLIRVGDEFIDLSKESSLQIEQIIS